MPKVPVSQRQIAQELGVSQASVSMALSGNPKVSAETRSKILAKAEELAYRPDPSLRALTRYRRKIQGDTYRATLAWVYSSEHADAYKHMVVYPRIFQAAAQRAYTMGYLLEPVWVDGVSVSGSRASKILESRGIRSILQMPDFSPCLPLDLDWERFTVVQLTGCASAESQIHNLISADHATNISRVLRELKQRNYKKPGLITSSAMEGLLGYAYSGSFSTHGKTLFGDTLPDIFYNDVWDAKKIEQWLHYNNPDCLVLAYTHINYPNILKWIKDQAIRVPYDLGVVSLCLPDTVHDKSGLSEFPQIAGIDEKFEAIGDLAARVLISQEENFERGIPQNPIRHMIAGDWVEADSLRPR